MTKTKARLGDEAMTCHACGQSMVRGVRPMEFEYKGKKASFNQPGWYCECGESVHVGEDITATEAAFANLKAEVDGLVNGGEAARIRKQLGLSQRKAGMILGGGENAFQRYEAGKDLPTRAMSNLLRLLKNDPGRLHELPGHSVAATTPRRRRSRQRRERQTA
ncbi:MAG: type II toxin-antitoxin system MqsA family antitoxin [Methylocella sp.]